MTKLHLGCGQRYLDGYINIDFPLSEHSVQDKSVADIQADILALRYPAESVSEVRLHHVFEHFTRPVACALVAGWNSWLKPGGTLHIEVPDFHRTAKAMINPWRSMQKRAVAERHLFGSHEAHWAAHYEGYTPALLAGLVGAFGFKTGKIRKNSWQGTYNFELIAHKVAPVVSPEDGLDKIKKYLSNFLLNQSPDEIRLLSTWLEAAQRQLDQCWAQ